jgi:SAM-dependent methyltransferase
MEDRHAIPPNAHEVEYWNSAAARPWAERHERIDRMFAGVTQQVLDAAAPQPGETVIDIGCGSGTTVLELAARVGPGGSVLGADISKQSLERARERITASGLRHAEVILADVSTYAFAPSSFDLAFSRFGVMFFTDPTAAFSNVRRAMKPSGRLTFAVFRTARENVWVTAQMAAIRHLFPPPSPPGPDEPGQFSWADPTRVHRILEGAGFHDVSLTPLDPLIRIAEPGAAADAADFAMILGPAVRAMLNTPTVPREAVRSSLEAFFQSHDGPEGVVLPGALWIVRARA